MKNNLLKRAAAGIFALAMLCSSAACASGSNSNKTKPQQTADQVIQNSYRAVEIGSDIELDYVEKMVLLGDTGKILITGSDSEGSVMLITDTEFAEFTRIDFQPDTPENGECYYRTAVSHDGTIFAVVTTIDYGEFEMPDYEDPDFDYDNFNFEAMYAAATYSYKICTLDSEGNIITDNPITGIEKYAEDEEDSQVYMGESYPCGSDQVVVSFSGMYEKYVVIGSDGNIIKELDLGEDVWFYTAGSDADGNLAFVTWDDGGEVIKTIDTEKLELADKDLALKDIQMSGGANTILPGSGDYRFYISGNTGLYGIKADGTAEELINWIDSDLNGDYIRGIVAIADGEFVVYERNWSNNESGFYRLTKRDSSELANTVVVTMAMMWSDSEITAKINEFNKSSDKYRIRIEDYSKYDEWDENSEKMLNSAAKQLKLDIVSGKSPDMIYCYDDSIINTLANKGVYADLYEFMGKDGTVSKEEILPNLLEGCEVNGKLVSLSPGFYVSTMAAKTKFCDKEGWTLDELIDTYNNLPEGMRLFNDGNSKENVFYMLMNGSSEFIDLKNGTCHFDSPEFVKLLEFSNRFSENDELDWETATEEEIQNYFNEREVACRNDKALLSYVTLSDREYARARYGFIGDDITFVGYPSAAGNGGVMSFNSRFAILNDSANKEACWSFISQFFTEEYQSGDSMYMTPALISAFEKKMDQMMEKPYYLDENGEKVEYDDFYWIMDQEMTIPPITKEERDFVADYILSAKPVDAYGTEDVNNIINEEIQAYFAGERSAQETAELIQNRASIVISEQS